MQDYKYLNFPHLEFRHITVHCQRESVSHLHMFLQHNLQFEGLNSEN